MTDYNKITQRVSSVETTLAGMAVKPDLATTVPVANTGVPALGTQTTAAKADHNHGSTTAIRTSGSDVVISPTPPLPTGTLMPVLTATSATTASWQLPPISASAQPASSWYNYDGTNDRTVSELAFDIAGFNAQIPSSGLGFPPVMVALDPAGSALPRILVVWYEPPALFSTNMTVKAVIGTVSDASISYGAAVTLSGLAILNTEATSLAVTRVATDKVIIAFRSGAEIKASVVTTGNSLITAATPVKVDTFNGTTSAYPRMAMTAVGTDKAVITWYDGTNSRYVLKALACTGTAITFGTLAPLVSAYNMTFSGNPALTSPAADTFVMLFCQTGTLAVSAVAGTVSSSAAITLGTSVTTTVTSTAFNGLTLTALSSTQLLGTVYNGSPNLLAGVKLTLTASTTLTCVPTSLSPTNPGFAGLLAVTDKAALAVYVPSSGINVTPSHALTHALITTTGTTPKLMKILGSNTQYLATEHQQSSGVWSSMKPSFVALAANRLLFLYLTAATEASTTFLYPKIRLIQL